MPYPSQLMPCSASPIWNPCRKLPRPILIASAFTHSLCMCIFGLSLFWFILCFFYVFVCCQFVVQKYFLDLVPLYIHTGIISWEITSEKNEIGFTETFKNKVTGRPLINEERLAAFVCLDFFLDFVFCLEFYVLQVWAINNAYSSSILAICQMRTFKKN